MLPDESPRGLSTYSNPRNQESTALREIIAKSEGSRVESPKKSDMAAATEITKPTPLPDVSFSLPSPEPVTRFASMTWRMMEEARMNALEEVKDIDAQIAALEVRRRDAMKAANMCEVGQKVD